MSEMSTGKGRMPRWLSYLVTVAALAVLSAVLLATIGNPRFFTTAPTRQASNAMPPAVAQETETLHAADAEDQSGEDETGLPLPASTPSVSPERALQLVQQSGKGDGQVYDVSLTTTATGQLVYVVRAGGPNGTSVQVDAETGAILSP